MISLGHLVVLDFEATCDDREPPEPQEIIEFPSVLLDGRTLEVVAEHESFVRPVRHPTLTPFCTELTSIEQADVDSAPTFTEAYAAHTAWLAEHGLGLDGEGWAFVTCGDWDLRTMFPRQLEVSGIDYLPPAYRRWINIKEPFRAWRPKLRRAGMARMLQELGLELEGRHHRGIDDSRNIAKIVRALAAHQAMGITSELPASRYPTIDLVLRWGDERRDVELKKRSLPTLLGLASEAFRRGMTEVREGDRLLETDADLHELRSGTELHVRK